MNAVCQTTAVCRIRRPLSRPYAASVCLAACRTVLNAYVGRLVRLRRVFPSLIPRKVMRMPSVVVVPVVDETCVETVVPKLPVVVAVSG